MGEKKVAAILGVGPGLGSSVAERFAREGFTVALMSRGEEKLTPVKNEIEQSSGSALTVPCDATEPASVAAAFERIRDEAGPPEVLVYNAGIFHMGSVVDTDPKTFEACWKANCFGAFLASREVLPAMIEAGRGTILLTGATASLRGSANFANLAVGKWGLRALAQSMARENGPKGVHIGHVIIDGQILLPRTKQMFPDRADETFLSPDAIADVYWQLHTQHPTTWTLELDLRPHSESF